MANLKFVTHIVLFQECIAEQPQGDKLIAEAAKASEQTYATTSLSERKNIQAEVRRRQLKLDELNSSMSAALKQVTFAVVKQFRTGICI